MALVTHSAEPEIVVKTFIVVPNKGARFFLRFALDQPVQSLVDAIANKLETTTSNVDVVIDDNQISPELFDVELCSMISDTSMSKYIVIAAMRDESIQVDPKRVNLQQEGIQWSQSKDRSRLVAGYAGLLNQGATCYLNSVVQSLYMLPRLPRFFPMLNAQISEGGYIRYTD